jgi:DNA-directed RNA polymerase specialized sigma24 family protein
MQQPERMMLDDAPGAGAGAALYQRYAPAIFAYPLKQTASREDAEDLLLEVFLAAMERDNLSDLHEPEQRAWLLAVRTIKRWIIFGGKLAIPTSICTWWRKRSMKMSR